MQKLHSKIDSRFQLQISLAISLTLKISGAMVKFKY